MKKIIPICLLIFLFSGCQQSVEFNMDYHTSTTIPSSSGVSLPFNVNSPDMTTNSESTFKNENTNKDLVDKILLNKTSLTVSMPSNGNFEFLKSVIIYIKAEGLSEKKIAWNENIKADAGQTIDLTTSPDDLKEYIKTDKFTLRVNTVTDEILFQDYTIDIYTLFRVSAKLL